MSSPFYFVSCTDGALALYYKSGAPEASQVVLSAAETRAAEEGGFDPQFVALLRLSDAFADRMRRISEGNAPS